MALTGPLRWQCRMVRSVLRSLSVRPLAAQSYLRVVFVLVGAALALALGIVGFTVLSLASMPGVPSWAMALIGVVLVGGPLMVVWSRRCGRSKARRCKRCSLFSSGTGPPGAAVRWSQRWRTLAWFLLHLMAGAPLSPRYPANWVDRQLVDDPCDSGDSTRHAISRPDAGRARAKAARAVLRRAAGAAGGRRRPRERT